jgi:hypothetical protein
VAARPGHLDVVGRHRRVTRTTARALDKALLLAATLCLAGNAYHVPSRAFWDALLKDRFYLLLVFLAVVGVFGALTPFESWHARSLADRNVTTRRRVMSCFGRMLEISEGVSPPLPLGDLGLHVWKRVRTLRHPVHGVLRRVATYRMATSPLNRAFTPTRGVGAVGLCWSKDHEYQFDVGPLVERLRDEETFDRYAAEHGGEAVMNLSWVEFEKVKHRTALFATPVRNGRNKFVGCISVDASRGFEVLHCRELIEEMSNLGLAIGREEFECT